MDQSISNLANLLKPALDTYIWMAITFVFTLLFKDILTTLLYGFLFYLDKNFNEGDEVLLDGEEALIVKIGIRKTVFMMKKTGNWRYVVNDKIRYLKLEKKKHNGYN